MGWWGFAKRKQFCISDGRPSRCVGAQAASFVCLGGCCACAFENSNCTLLWGDMLEVVVVAVRSAVSEVNQKSRSGMGAGIA